MEAIQSIISRSTPAFKRYVGLDEFNNSFIYITHLTKVTLIRELYISDKISMFIGNLKMN